MRINEQTRPYYTFERVQFQSMINMKSPNRLNSAVTLLARRLSAAAEEVATEATAEVPVFARRTGKEARLYRRLSAVNATGSTISQTLNEYIREGRNISKMALESCIKELRKYNKYSHALEIMDWMEKRGMNFSHIEFTMRLDLIAKVKGITEAENYFNSGLPQNKRTYGALLNCYCKEGMEDKALALFEKMDELNVASTPLAFNNLMSLYMKLDKPEKVPPLVDEMKKRNIPLQTFTYNILMHSYTCLNDIEQVERILGEMENEDKDKCDSTVYSNIAASYVKAGLIEKAKLALKKVETKMEYRDRLAYHFLISLNAKISNLSEVKRIWNTLKLALPEPNNMSYLNMLHALAKVDDVEGLKECFEEWKSITSYHDMRLANVAIRVYLKHNMIKEAELVFDDASKKTSGPLFTAREIFMSFFLKNRRMDLALGHMEAAVSEVKGDEWSPAPELMSAFSKYFDEEKDVNGAEYFCKLMSSLDSEAKY